MINNELLIQLQELKQVVTNYENAMLELESARNELANVSYYNPSFLKEFDNANKNQFIFDEIGAEPKRMGKWSPLNFSRKIKDREDLQFENYFKDKEIAENLYYQQFNDIREKLIKKDAETKQQMEEKAKKRFKLSEENFYEIQLIWRNDNILPETLRTSIVIKKMIIFLENGRVDTVKEAINLYFVEKRRDEEMKIITENFKSIMEAIKQQNETTEKISGIIDSISNNLEVILVVSKETLETSKEVYNLVEEKSYV